MKKILTVLLISFLSVSALFAYSIKSGAYLVYDPFDCNIFNRYNILVGENYGWGLTNDFQKNHFALTQDIRFRSVKKGALNIDTVTYLSYRWNLPKNFWIDLGAGLQIGLENAVEGSSKLYLTTNGVNIKNLFEIKKNHLIAVAGMIRFRDSFGYNINDRLSVRLDGSINLYSSAMIYPEGDVFDFLGQTDVSIGLMYKWREK